MRERCADPLASFRSGPEGIIDLSEKLITGVARRDALKYLAQDGGGRAEPSEVLVTGVTLRDADLRRARLTLARLLDLDAQRVRLDGATAIEARLSRVNLAGASLRQTNFQAVLARDCDFSSADLVGARWYGGTAIRCSFAGAELVDLGADRAVFLDCDLQGVDLSVGELGARVTMTGAQFLRCDLRWSRWEDPARIRWGPPDPGRSTYFWSRLGSSGATATSAGNSSMARTVPAFACSHRRLRRASQSG